MTTRGGINIPQAQLRRLPQQMNSAAIWEKQVEVK